MRSTRGTDRVRLCTSTRRVAYCTRAALILLALGLAAGCSKRDQQAEVVEDVELLSRDLCIRTWLSDGQRRRIVRAAKAGRITKVHRDAYVNDVREKRLEGERAHMDEESFCRVQRNVWRRWFMR